MRGVDANGFGEILLGQIQLAHVEVRHTQLRVSQRIAGPGQCGVEIVLQGLIELIQIERYTAQIHERLERIGSGIESLAEAIFRAGIVARLVGNGTQVIPGVGELRRHLHRALKMRDCVFHVAARKALPGFVELAAGPIRDGQLLGRDSDTTAKAVARFEVGIVNLHLEFDAIPGVGLARTDLDRAPDFSARRDEDAESVSAGQQVAESKCAIVFGEGRDFEGRGRAMKRNRCPGGGDQRPRSSKRALSPRAQKPSNTISSAQRRRPTAYNSVMIEYADASPEVRAVYDDIMATRQTDWINNFWKALAHDPATLRRTWESIKQIMAPGALDALTKEMLYLAVSATNQCPYCIASHTAAARKAGMSRRDVRRTDGGGGDGQRDQPAGQRLPG